VITWHEFWGDHWRTGAGGGRFGLWRLARTLERRAARRGDAAIAVSDLVARRVAAVRSEPVAIVPNGVVARRRGAPLAGRVVHVGRVIAHKRIGLLIEAMQLVREAHPAATLTIVGDGPERADLEDLATAIDSPVTFTGHLDDAALADELGRAALLAVTSEREGFGMVALEAMASGIPVVFTDGPESAVGELVTPAGAGVACEPTAPAVAAAITALLDDPGRAAEIGAAGRQAARRFGWDRVAIALERVLAAAGVTAEGASA
jgi:glycosyltransferase involved in cell wall biosynthesis